MLLSSKTLVSFAHHKFYLTADNRSLRQGDGAENINTTLQLFEKVAFEFGYAVWDVQRHLNNRKELSQVKKLTLRDCVKSASQVLFFLYVLYYFISPYLYLHLIQCHASNTLNLILEVIWYVWRHLGYNTNYYYYAFIYIMSIKWSFKGLQSVLLFFILANH